MEEIDKRIRQETWREELKIGDEVDFLQKIETTTSWDFVPAVIEGVSPDGQILQLFLSFTDSRVKESRYSGRIQNGGKARAKQDFRNNLRVGDEIYYLQNRSDDIWHASTILDVLSNEDSDGRNREEVIEIARRLYRSYGEDIDEQNRRYNGHSKSFDSRTYINTN